MGSKAAPLESVGLCQPVSGLLCALFISNTFVHRDSLGVENYDFEK